MSETLVQAGAEGLAALLDRLDLAPEVQAAADERYRLATASWGEVRLGDVPSWPSDVCDDGSPVEWSLAFDRPGPPVVRMLVEQGGGSWEAGRRFQERWVARSGGSLEPFDRVADLVEPAIPGLFRIWHGLSLTDPAPAKVYLNPAARGASADVAREALSRAGWTGAEALEGVRDVRYLGLDLDPTDQARFKVYLPLTPGAVDAEMGAIAACLCREPDPPRPVLVALAFSRSRPTPEITLHVPIRFHCRSDREALALLDDVPVHPEIRDRLRAAVDVRGPPALTYLSFCRRGAHLRLTAYLAPNLYSRRTG